jgi:hypothetical protein
MDPSRTSPEGATEAVRRSPLDATSFPVGSTDGLLAEIQSLTERLIPESPEWHKALAELGGRPGAVQQLVRVLRESPPWAGRLASLVLREETTPLIRRSLQRDAAAAAPDRRLNPLVALRDDELLKQLGTLSAGAWLDAGGVLALRNPTEFVDMLCDRHTSVDPETVSRVEQVRTAFAIGPESMLGRLLQRRLRPDARRMVLELLGQQRGHAIRPLLDQAHRRSRTAEERRTVLREQLRHATAVIERPAGTIRQGFGRLEPLDAAGRVHLEIVEDIGDGRVVHTIVCFGHAKGAALSVPMRATLDEAVTPPHAGAGSIEIRLGQVRTLLEGLTGTSRVRLAHLVERLHDTPPEPLDGPQPTEPLAADEVHALMEVSWWQAWRPFVTGRRRAGPAGAFRGATARRVAEGLRFNALAMHLVGDERAPRVAADAVWAARGRRTPLVKALAQHELREGLI